MPQRLTLARRLSKHHLFTSPKLIALGLTLALLATAFLARQYFSVTAQEQSGEQIQLTRIAADAEGSAGVAHHQPTGSLLIAADGRAELMANDGTRIPFSLIGNSQGKLASARASKNGFVAGETFVGADGPGAINRVSTDGARAQNPWVTLPGEIGLVRNLFFDHSELFNGNLIAVTTSGGVWRIDAEGNAARVTPMITARSQAGEESPVAFESVTVAPNNPARYGSLAGKILAIGERGLVYAIDADGGVESFDLGLRQTNNILLIPANENFFGVTIERQTASDGQTTNQRTIWGAAAANFAQGETMAGDFLITQGGGEACRCRPTLWRAHWNGSEFEKTKLAEVPGSNEKTEWAQATFSPFGDDLFARTTQSNQQPGVMLEKSVVDLNGGLLASGDELRYTLRLNNQSSSPITKSFIAEFIPPNVTYVNGSVVITAGANQGAKTDAIDNDQVDVHRDGQNRAFQINIGTGAGAGGHDIGGRLLGGTLAPGQSNTVEFRVRVNPGLLHNSLVINGANFGADDRYPAGSSNIVVLPPATLDKTVVNESNPGGPVLPGQFLRYELTLRNVSPVPVNKTFIAEFIPAGVTYQSGSVRVNGVARTDACGDDQVDYFTPTPGNNGQINIATGAGAGPVSPGSCGLNGGTLAPGETVTVTFRVQVNTGLTTGAIVSNGANVGANDIYPVAASNVLTTPVSFAIPLLGPFGQPAAVGPTDNNDDFTRLRVNLNASGGVTTETGNVRFINTLRNAGAVPGKFVIRAVAIAPGFTVSVSVDSGATFTSLNGGATATTPTAVNPGEERNLDVRIGLPTGLSINTDYPVILQANWDVDPVKSNRTIDIVRVDPNPPNLTLVKGVRDLSGADLDGKTVTRGQTIEYTLTLRNNSTTAPAGNTFIAEYLPPNVTYVANSTRIVTGPNAGPKTDDPTDGDQVAFYPTSPGGPNGQINIFTGTGATNIRGGTLAPGESTTVAFRVMVNAAAPVGTDIRNGADWGAEDFAIGGKSNIVTVTVVDFACTPLLGPFDQPDAGTPPDRNDDVKELKVNLSASGGLTTETGAVRFINTLRNVGTMPNRFVISAPTIPAGFTVRVSVDSGATFVSLNSGGTATTPTPLDSGESRNLDVRIDLPVGLSVTTAYDTVLQAACESDPARTNRTTDRVRVDPNAPPLTLLKGVRDLSGADLNGRTALQGQTIEYTLTLRNTGTTPVGNTFIAEYLPPNVTYVANSTQIVTGPNVGPKTDARGDDQVDYFPTAAANGQINIFTGTGATAQRGGALAPGESTTVVFRVTVNTTAPFGTIIRNGADWGAEDFGIGGKSNIVTVTVAQPLCDPLLGPFDRPDAVGPTNNNDDFTLLRANLNVSGGVTTKTGAVRFINTLRNVGSMPNRFIISAPTIPAGFTVRVSVDSGATFVSLNSGGTATTPTPLNPGESRNLDVRIDLPVGLALNTNYDLTLQAACESDPARFNRTIDRVRIDPNAPPLTLVKAVRDLNGNDISGQALCAGQTIEYTLTLRNAGTTPVGGTFIAEYIPANVTYVANSTRITAGPNAGAKTDARGDDQVDYFPTASANGQINIFTGAGATSDRGGTLAPGESTTVAFRVTINANTPVGTIIRNGADWGAEDFGIGGKSNIVEVTVGATQPPIITTQPANQTVCVGQSATFSVVATGANLRYQWRKNGVNIAGATSASFTIASAAAGDAAQYDVVITNVCGSVTSNAATLTVNPVTAITTQPANQTVCAGAPATFTVVATGANLTYQWRKGGVNIAGATSSSFTIAATAAGDAGSYDVVVTGACGTVTSAAATLTVNPATAITTQPANQTVCAGAPATFTVVATGANLTYQWRKGGVNIAGATAASFTITATTAGDAGSYDVVVTGTCGTITSNAATLTINPVTAITTQPANQTVCAGAPATFTVVASGANLTYQWRKNGVNIAGATGSSFTIASAAAGDAGSYDVVVTGTCGTVTSNAATLTVNPATAITTQPANQTVCAGQPATFTVVATGANLTYQWRKNGVNIANATGSSFTIASTAAGDAGSYDVVVTGTCGAVTSNAATLTVNPATAITTQPANQTVCAGQSATFTVVATGANLTYQWRRNGVNILNATGASFTIAATTVGDAGSYDVVVTGTCGTVTSNAATLTVNPATAITTQPANQTVCAGQPVTFTVVATGAGLTYQWRKNGVNIAGATGSSFTIPSAAAGDAGSYDVVVMGACGTVTSAAATLTVNPATAIATQPANQTVCAGQPATFTVAATGAVLTYQWRRNGVNIAGATGSSFTIASATAGDAGAYDVVVMGACGTVASAIATLTVNPATVITTQPANQTVCAGTSVAFTVTATGANLTYQWRKNGVNIAGATLSMFMIASAAAADAGNYDVVVTGACGTVTSAAATLTVNQCPPPGGCSITICFRSARYFSLFWGTREIPKGSVQVDGVNFGAAIPSTDPRVKLALDGSFGALVREHVAAQLNLLSAAACGLGSANIVSALQSVLRCYGLSFNPVTVGNGAVTFTPETKLGDLLNYLNSAVKGSVSSRDACVLTKLLNGLNGDNIANVCHRPTGPIDFTSCN